MLEKVSSAIKTSIKFADMWHTDECLLRFRMDTAKELLAFIESNPFRSVYDSLCTVLTNYENDDGTGDAGDSGERLYQEVVQIVNDMAEKIN